MRWPRRSCLAEKLLRNPPLPPKIRRTLEQKQNLQCNQGLTSAFLFYGVGFVLLGF